MRIFSVLASVAPALLTLAPLPYASTFAHAEEPQSGAGRQDKLPAMIMVSVGSQYFGEFGAFEEMAIKLELCSESKLASLLKEKYPSISDLFENPSVTKHFAELFRETYGHASDEQMVRAKEMTIANSAGFNFGYRVAMTKVMAQDEKLFCDSVRSSFADAMKAASSWADKPLK